MRNAGSNCHSNAGDNRIAVANDDTGRTNSNTDADLAHPNTDGHGNTYSRYPNPIAKRVASDAGYQPINSYEC